MHLHGDHRWEGQVSTCLGPSGWGPSLKSLPGPETHRPPPQVISASLWEVRSPLLVYEWGDLREPEWVHPVSPERGGVAGSYILFPGPLDVAQPCPDTWPLSEATFTDGLWSRWRLWGSTCVCKPSLWSSTDAQEGNRILWVPLWALCLDSGLVPWEFGWAFAFISWPFLPCVPHFRSTQEPEECLLVAKILWAESYHWGPHSKGEEEGTLSKVDMDLQSRPAVCALLVLESIALAIRC